MTTASAELATRIRKSFQRQTMMQSLGAEIMGISPGSVTLRAPLSPAFAQQQGHGHAAVTFALGDSAAGYSALSMMAPDHEVVTAEIKINLLSPASGEALIATGHVIKPGRRLFVVRADVHAEANGSLRPVAVLMGTMVPVDA